MARIMSMILELGRRWILPICYQNLASCEKKNKNTQKTVFGIRTVKSKMIGAGQV